MFWFSQISLNRLTHSSAICFTSRFLPTLQEMHAQPPSLQTTLDMKAGTWNQKSHLSIWSGACQVAVLTLCKHTSVLVTLGHTAPLPASFLTTPALSLTKLLAGSRLGWPHCPDESSHHYTAATTARPVQVSSVMSWCCSLPHPGPLPCAVFPLSLLLTGSAWNRRHHSLAALGQGCCHDVSKLNTHLLTLWGSQSFVLSLASYNLCPISCSGGERELGITLPNYLITSFYFSWCK